VAAFERLVSKPRLDKYRPPNGDDLETLVRYLWNAALSESLLQGLAALEVGLRNAVHNTLVSHVGTEWWFQAVLKPQQMKPVTEAWTTLSNRHKRPPTPGQVIAELTFGFWPPLFDHAYHDLWWSNHTALFKSTFPHIPTGLPPHQAIVRKDVHLRVDRCQKLRNRVMHHEPIFGGLTVLNQPTVPLIEVHGHIVEVLGWIDPQLATTLDFVDRFADIHRHEETRLRTKLKAHFGIT
jgi:hypothetical protein